MMTNPSWFEHVDLMQGIIVLLFSGFMYFSIRALKKIDANQSELFTRLHTLEKDFYELSGEHRARAEKTRC